MEYFINKTGEILSFEYYDGQFSLYNKTGMILSTKTKLKDISTIIAEPIYYNSYLILFDYDRGIEIINNGINNLLKIRAVIHAEIFDDILLVYTNRRIVAINYLNLEIIEENTVSENFDFARTGDEILIYRIKRNKSYLYNIKSKKLLLLNKLPIFDNIIFKIVLTGHIINIFFGSCNGSPNPGVIEYDIISGEYIKRDFLGKASANGYAFMDFFTPIIDEKIKIIETKYEYFIKSLIEKYGLFWAFYLADESKILQSNSIEGDNIKKYFMEYKNLIKEYFPPLRSYDALDDFKQNLADLEIRVKNDFNKK